MVGYQKWKVKREEKQEGKVMDQRTSKLSRELCYQMVVVTTQCGGGHQKTRVCMSRENRGRPSDQLAAQSRASACIAHREQKGGAALMVKLACIRPVKI